MRKVLSVLALCFAANAAYADDTHYQTFVTGGRAVSLGGAFCSIANDPSGLIYNPAGLVDDSRTDISISADLYGFQRTSQGATSFSPTPPLSNITQAVSDVVVIPSSSGYVRTFQSDGNGGYLNAIAVGAFVPEFQSTDDTYSTTTAAGSKTYRSTVTDRTLMPGIGYSRKVGDFRFGISTFYVLRLLSSDETSSLTNQQGGFRIGDASSNVVAGALRWVLGAKWVPTSRLALGLALTLPDVGINSQGSIRYRQGTADPSAPAPAFTQVDLENLRSGWHEPAVIKAGTSLRLLPELLVALDVTFYLPVSYDLLQVNDPAARAVLPFVLHVDRRATANVNVGAEWEPYRKVVIGAGFFTDFASSNDLSGSAYAGALTARQLPSIDNYGFAATFGWKAEFTTTRVGVMYSAGSGYDVVAQDDVARLSTSAQSYERVRVFNSFFYVFISSTLRL